MLTDFTPIVPLTTAPNILVARKSMPARDLNELIVWLKANPNRASVGIVSVNRRLQMALFQRETGTQVTFVPYRGMRRRGKTWWRGKSTLLSNYLMICRLCGPGHKGLCRLK